MMRFLLIVLLLVVLFGVTVIPSNPLENVPGKIVAKWDKITLIQPLKNVRGKIVAKWDKNISIRFSPMENVRGNIVDKWDRWCRFLEEIGKSLQEVGTTVEDNLLQAGEELKAKEAECQASVDLLVKKEQEKEQTQAPISMKERIMTVLRAMNAFTMHTLRFYFAVLVLVLSLLGMYFWSYLFVTYVFDSGE